MKNAIDGLPHEWHDSTFKKFMLICRPLLWAMITMLGYHEVWPILIHMFNIDLVLSSDVSHIQGVVKEFKDHVHVLRVYE